MLNLNPFLFILTILLFLTSFDGICQIPKKLKKSGILSYELNPKKQELHFFWKDGNNENYKNFQNLKTQLEYEGKELVFATNGGMYKKDLSPQGLYIEQCVEQTSLDTLQNGYGNFYLQPNGIFYITEDNIPTICTTTEFSIKNNIKYATQSGPMLVINGALHPKLNQGSPNVHIRNGVGILANGNLIFAISKEKINFYDFASFFKNLGCKNALYLDGFVSRTYLPSLDWKPLDGNFGVIIGEVKRKP